MSDDLERSLDELFGKKLMDSLRRAEVRRIRVAAVERGQSAPREALEARNAPPEASPPIESGEDALPAPIAERVRGIAPEVEAYIIQPPGELTGEQFVARITRRHSRPDL